ncbi:unnamed protein product [Thlaspi arvense]|uniref:Uncharacterized protein n=1 Tax=Thlaspi arvense TaxID=13288 RepID=A0AAU9T0H6_THLAR|nr:unnamed protein product [Thlaspi arvense]
MGRVGKSSLVHLILKGCSIVRPSQTIGCSVGVKVTRREISLSNYGMCQVMRDTEIAAHCSIHKSMMRDGFDYAGVIFVHDLSQRRTKTNLQKWAAEVTVSGTFSAPLSSSGGPCGLPVPYMVIGNKADIAAKEGTSGSSGNLVDAARQWVEKQGLLPHSDELPLSESFLSNGGLTMAAKEARYDKEALNKFFRMLIRRRYFSDEGTSDEDQFYKRTSLRGGDPYNTLPARNLTQPVSTHDRYSYSIPRFSLSSVEETNNGNAIGWIL